VAHAEVSRDLRRDLRERPSLAQEAGAVQVRGEVTVTQIEPRRFAEADDLSERAEALAAEPPAPVFVDPAAQRVANGVEVGGDVKPPDQRIVARVACKSRR
jgi:hypothetical protein